MLPRLFGAKQLMWMLRMAGVVTAAVAVKVMPVMGSPVMTVVDTAAPLQG